MKATNQGQSRSTSGKKYGGHTARRIWRNSHEPRSVTSDLQATAGSRIFFPQEERGHSYEIPIFLNLLSFSEKFFKKKCSSWEKNTRPVRDYFFLQTRIAIPRYFSQSYGAYFKMT